MAKISVWEERHSMISEIFIDIIYRFIIHEMNKET